jgi:hypothetical protein
MAIVVNGNDIFELGNSHILLNRFFDRKQR